ncbi:winged helix-turn-helix domain-containing protein [Nocardia otitidiscaviarum]|uniref:BTAD domain-containing putative transcriptional regulator n=1 Tax=Nocardia otitidiscaviarum TaxID=1823 RepID=UPI001894C754|nr:BTAD domain-containing putative transcriptional regulator [Nocardia otitidiscaviarum]MBF6238714.1 winged helix-turn-helix domain-containing protein [Nocardia otitidiscaviarum]
MVSGNVFRGEGTKVVVRMLIAVAAVASRSGVSSTALAVAALWPGPERVIVVEADPRGGSLALCCGGDPERGLASLTAAADETGTITGTDLNAHLQRHPSGVEYLAAPTAPERVSTALTHPIAGDYTPAHAPLLLIADCGIASADSAAAPLLAHADLLLLVTRAPGDDLARQLRELRIRYPRATAVLVGDPRTASTGLRTGMLGWLPCDESAATDLLEGRILLRRSVFAVGARALADAVRARLDVPATAPVARAWTPWRRGGRARTRRDRTTPRVYTIDCRPLGDTGNGPATRAHPPAATPAPTPAAPSVPAAVESRADAHIGSEPLAEQPDTVLAPCAPLAGAAADPAPMVTVRLFGPLRVICQASTGTGGQSSSGAEITARLQPRSREILALLAVHPDGLTRTQLIDTLWGRCCPHRPTNALHTALGRLRAALAEASGGAAGLVLVDSGRYRLDTSRVEVDYAAFTDAVRRRRYAATDSDRRETCERIISLAAGGTLAADLEAGWLHSIRQYVRHEAIAAVGALAQTLAIDDPRATVHLLATAMSIDPHNEDLYRDMMRLHARLGEHHAIAETLELLTRRLADIGEKPSRETRAVAHHLHTKHSRVHDIGILK